MGAPHDLDDDYDDVVDQAADDPDPPPAGTCEVCGQPGGVERDVPLRTKACDDCWQDAGAGSDSDPCDPGEPARPWWQTDDQGEVYDPRDPSTARCRRCGLPGQWYPTPAGKHVLMEPGPLPTHHVPAGERWHVAGDGTAVHLGRAHPDDDCRVTHWLLCPAAEPSPRLDGPLYRIWSQRRAQLDQP